MTRPHKQFDEPRRARPSKECPECEASFGNLVSLIKHGADEHGFEAFDHVTEDE